MSATAVLEMPPYHRQGRLFRKYIGFFVVLVSGALLVSGLLQLYFSYQQSQQAVFSVQQIEASRAATEIQTFLQEIQDQIDWAVHARQVGVVSDERLRVDYLRLLRQEPAITDIRHLNSAGKETVLVSRIDLNMSRPAADYSHDATFQKAKSGKTTFSPVYFRNDSEPYISIAVPERGPDDGVTFADVNLKLTWDVVSQIKVGKAGYAYVIDPIGQLIAHPDISLVLQKSDLSGLEQVKRAQAAAGGSRQPSVSRNLKGASVLTAYQSVDPLGWFVFVEQPVEDVLTPLYASLARTGLLLLGGLALSVLAGIVLARRMVTPIRALQMGASAIGAGNLDQRLEISTNDELEALAEEFNRMSANLKETYARVEERSQALAAALEDLEQKSQELERASQAKSEFLASMSHELRTPLNGIIGFSEILLNPGMPVDDKTRAEFLQNILNSGRHLLSLINDILDLSKVEAGKMELHPQTFSLRDALEGVHTIVAPAARQRQQHLELSVPENMASVRHDPARFKQVFLNLLSNAVKFTPEGGRITTSVSLLSDDRFEVSVTDTGIGISPENQEKIFDVFQQIDSGYARHQQGTGLGLALVRQFVEMMGGTIRVQSELGKGSTFTVQLPLDQDEVVELAEGEGPLILMVEDDAQAASLLSFQLGRSGFRTEQATHSLEALEKARQLHPSAITLDILLPEENDGWQVLRDLKAEPETKDIPVVIVSVLDDADAAHQAGAVAALVKPVDPKVLVSTLNQHVKSNGNGHAR